jgi:hypothetical protein
VHPNPNFAYRETSLRAATNETLVLETRFFDTKPEVHEAHLLAYLHLLEMVVISSDKLTKELLGLRKANGTSSTGTLFAHDQRERARSLAERDAMAKYIMQELGLWRF